MPKVKIPRKSTTIDMTAMCDVAFLLLSFFILATKQKPPEVLSVTPPASVSSKAAPEKAILITLTKEGKAFLMFGEDTKKEEVLENINLTKGLNLSAGELAKWSKSPFIGLPLNQIKTSLSAAREIPANQLPGIPTDSTNNEMIDWLRSVTNVYAGTDQRKLQEILLVKGDNSTLYPAFKQVKQAFKKNELYKFRIVTNGEAVPVGTELYNKPK
ncbi:MAG: biopolymer transporter ExbD [Ferruginibacter sp.]